MMQLLKENATDLDLCIHRLQHGGVVALPTETVYGLAALATHEDAVRSVFQLKNRPSFNPLIVHVDDLKRVEPWVHLDDLVRECADRLWPGPLTLLCPLKSNHGFASSVTAGLDTVALRIPSHPMMRYILERLGQPLAAPSANRSGSLSCTQAHDVMRSFSQDDDLWILDGGSCTLGLESTIVDTTCRPWRVLRLGGLTLEALYHALGSDRVVLDSMLRSDDVTEVVHVRSPGQLLRHYAPSLPLRLNVTQPLPGEVFLGFGTMAYPCDINLSPSGQTEEAATQLFSTLHQVDCTEQYQGIAVAPIPDVGLGQAINDRLRRAAASS